MSIHKELYQQTYESYRKWNEIELAIQYKFDGWTAWLCSAEDLIIQKLVAGRGKDISDVESLLVERQGNLDEPYILKWLGEFAAALEKPELIQEYQEIVRKIQHFS